MKKRIFSTDWRQALLLWQWGKTLIKRQNYEIWNIDDLFGSHGICFCLR